MKVSNDPRVDRIIRSISTKDNARIVQVTELFEEHGFSIPALYLKKLTRNLWEFRAGRWRLLFGLVGSGAIIVHIFLKKTQKTPKREIDLATKRFREYL